MFLKNAQLGSNFGGLFKKCHYINTLSSVESKKIFPTGFLVLAIVDLQRSQQDSSSESGKGSSEEKNYRKIGTVWRNVSEVS